MEMTKYTTKYLQTNYKNPSTRSSLSSHSLHSGHTERHRFHEDIKTNQHNPPHNKTERQKKSMILFGAVHIFVGLNPSFQSMDRLSGTVTEGSWVFLSQQSAAASHLAVGPQLWQFLLVYINMNYEYVRSIFIRILDTTQCVLFISIMQMFVIIINTDIFCCEVEFLDGVGRPSVFVLLLLINE